MTTIRRNYRYFDVIMVLFVAVLLISNIASGAKVVDVQRTFVGLPLIFDGGTLLFPLSYIFGDILTEVYGYARGRRVIWVGFACALLMSASFWILARLPGDPGWGQFVYQGIAHAIPSAAAPDLAPAEATRFGQAAYDAILGGVSSFAIVIASVAAYFAGEFSNSFVLAKMKIATAGRWLWTRTIGSTLIGQGVDSALFILIAAALGVFSWASVASLILTNYLLKVGIEVLFTPLTYAIVNTLKRVEQEDYFDRDTDFNPFHTDQN